MSINITNLGGVVNYHDNHKEVTINTSGANPADLLRAALAEDIEPVQTEKETPSDLPFLVVSKLQELNLYSLQEFEGKYRKAVRSDAKTLASFIKKYSELEVLDIKDRNKKQIFEELKAYFGAELDFGYPNFAAYY